MREFFDRTTTAFNVQAFNMVACRERYATMFQNPELVWRNDIAKERQSTVVEFKQRNTINVGTRLENALNALKGH